MKARNQHACVNAGVGIGTLVAWEVVCIQQGIFQLEAQCKQDCNKSQLIFCGPKF